MPIDIPAFAFRSDYEARYGAADERADVLLEDASGAMLAAYAARYGEPYREGAHPVFDANARAVCCSVAHAALMAPEGFEGASQYSQTAGPYTASVTYANPGGNVYIGKSDLRRLGLLGCRVGSISPSGGGPDA